jgi:hypothetical protein
MEAALRALLTSYVPLTTLVAQRIFWNDIPQATTDPCVVLYKITGAPGIHMQGTDRLEQSVVQINVRAVSVVSMWAVRDAIIARLNAQRIQQGTVDFKGIFLTSERQASEKPGTTVYHTCQLDFDVWAGSTV